MRYINLCFTYFYLLYDVWLYLAGQPVAAKLLAYNRANRTVAVLCNHQRAVPKNFDKQMENLQTKVCISLSSNYHIIIILLAYSQLYSRCAL